MPRVKSQMDLLRQYNRISHGSFDNPSRESRAWNTLQRYLGNIRNNPTARRATVNVGGISMPTSGADPNVRYPRSVYAPNIRQRFQSQSRGNTGG